MAEPIVISTLKKKRAEIAGHIDGLNEQLMQARADLVHVDATLTIFGYEDDPSMIRPRRKADRLFGRNEMQRLIIGFLKDEANGLNTGELTEAVINTKNWQSGDKVLFTRVMHRVNTVLSRMASRNQVVRGDTDGHFRVWRIAPLPC